MSCLLYGVVFVDPSRVDRAIPPVLPRGVGGASVRLLEADGLGLAASTIDSSEAAPNVERALAFARVIEALHADRVVMPLRFGSVVADEAEAIHLLHTRGAEYARTLRLLDGCVEMEVRVTPPPHVVVCGARRAAVPPRDVETGSAYLAGRKVVYTEMDRGVRDAASASERISKAFAGRFVRCHAEAASPIGPVPGAGSPLSTYFLVKRDALEPFREAFQALRRAEPAPLMLSGPWPPYNFVTPGTVNDHVHSSD